MDDDTEVQGGRASPLRRAVGWGAVSPETKSPDADSRFSDLRSGPPGYCERGRLHPHGRYRVPTGHSRGRGPDLLPQGPRADRSAAPWREGDPEKPGGNFRSRDSSVVSDAGATGRQAHLLCCDLRSGDVLSPQPRLSCTGRAYSSRTQPKTLPPPWEYRL